MRAAAGSSVSALLASGDAAWGRGARDSAYALYREAVQQDTAASGAALVRLAALEVERKRIDPAAALLRARLQVEPRDDEARVTLARLLAWRARYDEAIAIYEDVLGRDSTHHDAALGLAQALAWAGRLSEAERWFATVARRSESPEAERGLARIASWRGHPLESERRWHATAVRYPDEIENWIGLAQAQRWAGHLAAADTTLRRALALDPSSAEAREQLHWVQSDLRPAAEPTVLHATDSDGNRSTVVGVTLHSRSVGVVRWRMVGTRRDATQPGLSGTSVGGRARASWSAFDSRFIVAGEVGGTRLSGRVGATPAPARIVGSGQLLMLADLRPQPASSVALKAGAALTRGAFDETAALITGNIVTTALDGDLTLDLSPSVALNLAAGRTAIDGGELPNARNVLAGAVHWSARPNWLLSATARNLACDTTGVADGYFCPDRLRMVEAGVRRSPGDDRPWGISLDGGIGRQAVRHVPSDPTRSSTTWRAAAGVRFRPIPGYEIEASYGFSTAASPFARDAAGYTYRMFSLRGRLRL